MPEPQRSQKEGLTTERTENTGEEAVVRSADLENRYEPSIDWQLAILYQGLAEPLPLSQFCRDFSDSYDGLPLRIPETERSSSINGQ